MRIDMYTKGVLTVIAACLVWLSVGGSTLLTPVNAQAGSIPPAYSGETVMVAGWIDRTGTRHYLPPPLTPEVARERGIGLPTTADAANAPGAAQ